MVSLEHIISASEQKRTSRQRYASSDPSFLTALPKLSGYVGSAKRTKQALTEFHVSTGKSCISHSLARTIDVVSAAIQNAS